MHNIGNYLNALLTVLNPQILIFIMAGVFLGIVVGALPGLTAIMGIAILVPLTYGMTAEAGILTLIGVYIGAVYGGSISATLINIPGTPAAVMTTLDAYPMAQRGEAGRALGLCTVFSFIGGIISATSLMFFAPLLADAALKFTSVELFAVAIVGLSIIAYISPGSMIVGISSGLLGILLATIGGDPMTAYPRFTFGNVNLYTGIQFIPAMIGLYGLSEVISYSSKEKQKLIIEKNIGRVIPKLKDITENIGVIIRSSIIGIIIGAIPGTGATIASIVSYGQQKRLSKKADLLGNGSVEGIAAAETSNNACTGGALTTMIALGIPGDSATAILIGAFMIHGLRPGPTLFTENFDLVATIFIGLFVANIFMLIFGLLGAKLFAKILSVPTTILHASIIAICVVGSYAVQNNIFDVIVMLIFGILGFFMSKLHIPKAPLVLGLVLGNMAESNLRRALMINRGVLGFAEACVTRPIALVLILVSVVLIIYPIFERFTGKRLLPKDN